MGNEFGQAFCTNAEWIGRAHCDKCHIRQFMLFSDLPDSAFHDLLQPIDHFLFPQGSVLYEAVTHKDCGPISFFFQRSIYPPQEGDRRIRQFTTRWK